MSINNKLKCSGTIGINFHDKIKENNNNTYFFRKDCDKDILLFFIIELKDGVVEGMRNENAIKVLKGKKKRVIKDIKNYLNKNIDNYLKT